MVRDVNRTLPQERKLRVLLGDPPIDWDRIKTRADHRAWIEQREWYPAALIELEVLAKQRRALVVYGHGHFQRKNVQGNYENYGRLTDTIISLVEQATGTRAFIVWRDAGVADIQSDAQTWKPPVIALIKGTTLGTADFGQYFAQNNDRLAIRDGKITPIPRSEWRQLKAEEQFDAVLYLGPPSSIVVSTWSPALVPGVTTGWQGVLEAGALGFALTLPFVLPGVVARQFNPGAWGQPQAFVLGLAYVGAYGLLGLVVGLVLGFLLRLSAVAALLVHRRVTS